MKLFVWVTLYTHKHGNDINVFETVEQAEAFRRKLAADYWEDQMDGEPMPADPEEAADMYFEQVGSYGEEFFEIEQSEVIRAV